MSYIEEEQSAHITRKVEETVPCRREVAHGRWQKGDGKGGVG